jgi:hypothetical protein
MSAVVVVEDRAAATFLRTLAIELDYSLIQHVSIAYCQNGASAVERVVSELQDRIWPRKFKVLGVLDGDMRGPRNSLSAEFSFLPGDSAPERVMRDALDKWREEGPRVWNPSLAGGAETLELELAKSDGLNYHDWLYSVSGRYGGLESFMSATVGLILQDVTLFGQAQALMGWLRGSVTS